MAEERDLRAVGELHAETKDGVEPCARPHRVVPERVAERVRVEAASPRVEYERDPGWVGDDVADEDRGVVCPHEHELERDCAANDVVRRSGPGRLALRPRRIRRRRRRLEEPHGRRVTGRASILSGAWRSPT